MMEFSVAQDAMSQRFAAMIGISKQLPALSSSAHFRVLQQRMAGKTLAQSVNLKIAWAYANLFLTFRTVVRASSAHYDALDRCPAHIAVGVGPAVDSVL